ncbi:lipoyl synthase, partial [bacterium]|nr:lipoyl synthase [bacterium]
EMKTKSGIMVGFGETKADIIETMNDLKKVSCDILTIGQYLRPSEKHYPVNKYYTPEEFIEFRKIGEEMGFDIKSAPLVRSSFQLEEFA